MDHNNFICLAEEIKLIETLACKRLDFSEDILMQKAAKAVLCAVERFYHRAKRIIVSIWIGCCHLYSISFRYVVR